MPIEIDVDDVQAVCQLIDAYPDLVAKIQARLSEEGCAGLMKSGKFLMSSYVPLLNHDIYSRLAHTQWCIREWKLVPSSNELFLEIRKKEYLDPTPLICYHVTPEINASEIESNGITTGIRSGRHNCPRYMDSVYFIHVALTIEDAAEWARIVLQDTPVRCFAVEIRRLGCRLFADTAAGDSTSFICETDLIPLGYFNSCDIPKD